MRNEQVTPTLGEVIQMWIDSSLIEMNICLPGKIDKYNAATQYADVKPQLTRKLENGSIIELPIIIQVPVVHPRSNGGAARVHMPLKPGDDVTLVFSQRSLDRWKTSGGITDPADRRRFNLSDAIAIIGGSAIPAAFTVVDPDSIEITNGSGVIQVKPSGIVNLGTTAPSKSVAVGESVQSRLTAIESKLTSHITAYNLHMHPTAAPGPPSPPAAPDGPFVPDSSVVSSTKVKVEP